MEEKRNAYRLLVGKPEGRIRKESRLFIAVGDT
jgi:hypothetical protein